MYSFRNKGYTLLEIMFVTLIILILSGLSFNKYIQYSKEIKVASLTSDLSLLTKNISTYYSLNEPPSCSSLASEEDITADIVTAGLLPLSWEGSNSGNSINREINIYCAPHPITSEMNNLRIEIGEIEVDYCKKIASILKNQYYKLSINETPVRNTSSLIGPGYGNLSDIANECVSISEGNILDLHHSIINDL